MFPILFSFGPVVIYTWGVMLLAAILLAVYLFWRSATLEGYDEEKVLDLSALVILGGFIGARTVWFLTHASFGISFLRIFSFFSYPGFSFWGGVAAVALVGYWFCRRKRWNFWELSDYLALPAVFGQILSYFGHFLSGSAYGLPTRLFWGARIPGLTEIRHPVQVYIIIALAFLLLHLFVRSKRAYRRGMLILRALFGVALILTTASFFRAEPTFFGPFGWNFLENFVALAVVGAIWYRRSKRIWRGDLKMIFGSLRSASKRVGSANLIVLPQNTKITKRSFSIFRRKGR